jgi:hypothetical protein
MVPDTELSKFVAKAAELGGGAAAAETALAAAAAALEKGEVAAAKALYTALGQLPEHRADAAAGMTLCALRDGDGASARTLAAAIVEHFKVGGLSGGAAWCACACVRVCVHLSLCACVCVTLCMCVCVCVPLSLSLSTRGRQQEATRTAHDAIRLPAARPLPPDSRTFPLRPSPPGLPDISPPSRPASPTRTPGLASPIQPDLERPLVRRALAQVELMADVEAAADDDAAGADSVAALRERIAAEPADLAAKHRLATKLVGAGDHEEAITLCLAIVKADRAWNEEAGARGRAGGRAAGVCDIDCHCV